MKSQKTTSPSAESIARLSANHSPTKQIIHPLFIEREGSEIPINVCGSEKCGPSPTGIRDGRQAKKSSRLCDLQLLAPRGIPSAWAYRNNLFSGVVVLPEVPGVTVMAINYLLVQTVRVTARGYRTVVLPESVMNVIYEARYRGGRPIAELLQMMALPESQEQFGNDTKAELWAHFRVVSRSERRIRILNETDGVAPLNLSVSYAANSGWLGGKLTASSKPDGELQSMLWRIERALEHLLVSSGTRCV